MAEQEVFDGVEVGTGGGAPHTGAVSDHADAEPVEAGRPHRRSEDLFQSGRSHTPYKRAWSAGDSGRDGDLEGDDGGDARAGQRKVKKKACACRAVLEVHKERFQGMRVTLKKRQRYKLASETRQYRDLTKQNQWLLANVFDASGNYLYCMKCVYEGGDGCFTSRGTR